MSAPIASYFNSFYSAVISIKINVWNCCTDLRHTNPPWYCAAALNATHRDAQHRAIETRYGSSLLTTITQSPMKIGCSLKQDNTLIEMPVGGDGR